MGLRFALIRTLNKAPISVWCGVLVVAVGLLSCGPSDTTAFEAAQTDGSPEALEKFIHDFPDSRLIPVAKDKLEDARFERTKKAGTVETWKRFLADFPDGKHSADAKYEIEHLSYTTAKKANTKEAFEAFLKEYPNGPFSLRARRALDKLIAAEATPAPGGASQPK